MSCVLFPDGENAMTADVLRKELAFYDGNYDALFHITIRLAGFQLGIDTTGAADLTCDYRKNGVYYI